MMTRRAFTLLELLVVIAIVAILVGLLSFSMRGVRASASRVDSLAALRQIAVGYEHYAHDHKGQLLPGFIDIDDGLLDDGREFGKLTVTLPDGTLLTDTAVQAYVWRLSPYVNDAWETFFADVHDSGTMSKIQAHFSSGDYVLISGQPSYGLNSIFLGGDSRHGGPDVTDRNPWTGTPPKIAATRFSEVRNSARVIVFAPAIMADENTPGDPYDPNAFGYCEIRPPYVLLVDDVWEQQQWNVGEFGGVDAASTGAFGDGAGLPIDRVGKREIPVVHFDGSAAIEQIASLSRDMRRWDPIDVRQLPTNP
jgi:prepilin-type N-terminal cleavage/methylation domain-containing protein